MVRLNVDMKSTNAALTIGEVAGRFGLPAHVLRHWESVGLLAPVRAEGDVAATARTTCTAWR